jgi:hypothetical protein
MTTVAAISTALESAMKVLQGDLREELKAQGHYLTGKLHDSIKYEITQGVDAVVATMECEEYGLAMELGVAANRIPYSGNGGGGTSQYIQGLITFFELRGLQGREAIGAAFATANVQRREGMPTRGSYQFSSNGQRIGFATTVLQRDMSIIEKILEDQVGLKLSIAFPESIAQKMDTINFYW